MNTDLIFVYITTPSQEKAAEIAKKLLEAKLIACANIFPIKSIYRWEGKVVEDSECVLLAKTTAEKYDKVKVEVEKIHPYTTPCIVKISASANEKYFEWVRSECNLVTG